jgi:predicted DNA-binding protein
MTTTKTYRFTPVDMKNLEEIHSLTGNNYTEILRIAIMNYLNEIQDCYSVT